MNLDANIQRPHIHKAKSGFADERAIFFSFFLKINISSYILQI